jgi:hypothetical protein
MGAYEFSNRCLEMNNVYEGFAREKDVHATLSSENWPKDKITSFFV